MFAMGHYPSDTPGCRPPRHSWRRGRTRVRRRGVRRYPPTQLLKAHVFLHPPATATSHERRRHNEPYERPPRGQCCLWRIERQNRSPSVAARPPQPPSPQPGASLVPRSPPTIEELLWTIRDAWPPPRSLSLDSEKRDKSKVPVEVMGTGSKKDQPAPRMGLPYRRYSVPETVMRRYSLSRAQTSASDVVTAPTPSVPSISTSSGAVRRMCHKACQTSPPDSASDSRNQPVTIPTVNIIPSVNLGTKEEMLSKHSSNSNEFSPSEEISDYGVCASRVYKSELSLPGAVVESARFLRVPELILDPHDSPQVNSDDNGIDENIINSEHRNSSVVNMERDKYTETENTLDDENLSSLLEQSDAPQNENTNIRSKSNSVPESLEPSTRTNWTGSAGEEHPCDQLIDAGELTMEQQLHYEQSLSPEGTPTPAPTCHTYDSQGNMLSECYITDCEVCNAEGRKCCSLDDSGSQSCSFTSPEMISSNELKSSTDFTTSSMTLDQTVSDRTTSTQDSTISLTSITPESAESKEKCSNINISPILVIESETTLVNVSPRSKNKVDRALSQQPEPSQNEISKSLSFLDKIPTVISCESGIVPESQNTINTNIVNRDFETKKDKQMSFTQQITSEQSFSELNNNKVIMSKDTCTQVSEPLSTIKENEVNQTTQGGSKYKAAHYLYISETESGNTQGSVDEGSKNKKGNQKIVGNYTTSHLYLTETESSPTQDVKEDNNDDKQKTGAYSTDYLYMTESESSGALKTLNSESREEANANEKSAGNYATNYMYVTESESSGHTTTSEPNDKMYMENIKKVGGNYSKKYLYMTESETPETGKTLASDSKEENKKSIAENYTTGAYATDYLYMTESESSGLTKTLDPNDKMYMENSKKVGGSYAKNYLYVTESESPAETGKTLASDSEEEEKRKSIAENYYTTGACATDYLYMTESESSEANKTMNSNWKLETEIVIKNVGGYAKNYMYMTESDSPETNKSTSSEVGDNSDLKNTCKENGIGYMTESKTSEATKTLSAGVEDLKSVPKNDRNFATDYLYMTETESSDNTKTTDSLNKEERRIMGNYGTNYMYMTESESPKTNNTVSSEEIRNINVVKMGTGNYATEYLYMTESESSKETKTSTAEIKEDKGCVPKSVGNFTTDYLYMSESESSKETKTSTAEIKEDRGCIPKSVGNFTTDYLYLTESESSENKIIDLESKVKVDFDRKKCGNSTTNYLYLTEPESPQTTKSSTAEDDVENVRKGFGGQYATSNLYMTESDSTPATKCLSSEIKEDLNSVTKNNFGNCATNHLYISESDSTGITKVSSENNDDISNKLTGNYSKGYLYLTESESAKTQTSSEEEIVKPETKIKQKTGRNYTTNFLYMTEDESSFNPDSLEIDRRSSKEDFDMDSLAINESTDESNMLENLGFCENSSTVKCHSKATDEDPMRNELSSVITQEMFYGNTKYEVILKDNDAPEGNFKGNVMPVSEEKIGPQPNNLLADKIISSPGMNIDQNFDLVHEREMSIGNELGCKVTDQETTMGSVAGGTYWEIPGRELVIPRFSALPRTLSMIVNTSSMDCSSDSDLSLADSLEDSKSDDKNKGLKLYNKYDNRLVRGDIIALLPEESEIPKKTSKESQAYFLSITGEEGEIKVEQIPEELKSKLLKRDMEIKKHSEHLSSQGNKCKGKNCSKKSKKHPHHHCCSSTADLSSKSSCKTKSLDEFSGKISKFTQWEDLDSSKDSSDTLVPSDFSEKDKDSIFQGDYKLKDVCTSPRKCEYIDNDQQNDLNCWLETVNNTSPTSNTGENEENEKNSPTNTNKEDKKQNIKHKTKEIKRLENKWVQCENMSHVDSTSDEEISRLLIDNSTNDNEIDSTEARNFKCAEHQVPWSKDMFVQVSQDELLVQDIVDVDVQTNAVTESKYVQTADNPIEDLKEKKEKRVNKSKCLLEETNKLELNLTGSPRNQKEKSEAEIQFSNVTEDDERCKTPVLGERPDSKPAYKPSPKFNVKSTPPRRPGNLGARFKQKFEVIPEEKSGSFESSNDEKKSPKPARGRRASMPSEMILKDLGHSQNKSSDSSTSSVDKKDSEESDHVRNIQTTGEGGDYHRRHTIHGNLTSRNTKTEATNQDKNEHSRRHTIHGSLSLSKNDAMLKQLNLLGGTLLKGRVFGKQSGVMFGRFRPINEETQVQKDERSLVEEQLERLRRDASKGREALAVARAEEDQEELLTLSKGWINFYLLRDSQELGSDGSNADEGSKESRSEERPRRESPSMKTVTVVGKSEEDLRHQFTVQINASPETCPESAKLPDICDQNLKSYKTPSLSPDLTLPDITPTSSPVSTPLLPDTPLSHKPELPQIHSKGVSRNKRSVNEKYKSNGRKPPERGEKKEKVHIDNDQNLRYMKLSSMKQELQTEKTYFARSGEIACSELSQSSSTSVTADSPTLPSIKWPSRQLQRRMHSRHLHTRAAPSNPNPNPQACWTVTLAGSSGNPTQPPPDVEMRLSFSNQQRGPATSQSDSGLGEDGPPERGHRGPHPHQALPLPSKHPPPDTSQWKVLLKTHQETERSSDQVKADKRASLPEFNFTPSTARQKKNTKRGGRGQEEPPRPGSVQVQEILEHNISLHKSSLTEEEWVEGLSVTGQAITPERKPRVPTMSERDLTRHWYPRSRLFH